MEVPHGDVRRRWWRQVVRLGTAGAEEFCGSALRGEWWVSGWSVGEEHAVELEDSGRLRILGIRLDLSRWNMLLTAPQRPRRAVDATSTCYVQSGVIGAR